MLALLLVVTGAIAVMTGRVSVRELLATLLSGGIEDPTKETWPVEAAGPLLTNAELSYFRVLEQVLRHPTDPSGTPQMRVFCKVRLADLVQPKRGLDRSVWQATQNKLDRKHVDFVLVDPSTYVPRLVIELDDASHRRARAQKADAQKDTALAVAGVRLLRAKTLGKYEAEDVAEAIRVAI